MMICLTIWLSRLCLFKDLFEHHRSRMMSLFLKKRYPQEIIDKEMSLLEKVYKYFAKDGRTTKTVPEGF